MIALPSPSEVLTAKQARALDQNALAVLFHEARTANGFLAEAVDPELLEQVVEAAKFAPTAMNASPLRIVFVSTPEGRERLRPALAPGNVDKTMSAPVTAIVGYDLDFHEKLPRLSPHAPAYVEVARQNAAAMATQNGTLQAAYLILAARAFGLDAGPMGGFDKTAVDNEFFAGTNVKSNILINLGYADDSKTYPRNPRLAFTEIATFA